jgi:hypothetical protein
MIQKYQKNGEKEERLCENVKNTQRKDEVSLPL